MLPYEPSRRGRYPLRREVPGDPCARCGKQFHLPWHGDYFVWAVSAMGQKIQRRRVGIKSERRETGVKLW